MSEQLQEGMTNWFKNHPGGQYALCVRPNEPLEPTKAHALLKYGFGRHPDWANIRGFHVFRHSFASNLAAAGIDQRMIDAWMGHQTEEMRRRYRHLLPGQERAAIDLVFSGKGQ